MRRLSTALILLPLLFNAGLLAQEENFGEPFVPQVQSVTSFDQRIVVYGSTNVTRTAVLSEITDLRNELSYILGSDEKGAGNSIYPLENDLIITLYGEPGDPAPANLFGRKIQQVDGSERFRIDLGVHLARGLNREDLRRETLECLLLDKGLRSEMKEGRALKLAAWIPIGLIERMTWRRGEADRGLYKALFKSGYMLDLDEMLEIEDISGFDAAQRTAFRISAGGFAMALLAQENGQETFRKFLAATIANEGEPSLLVRRYFFETGISEQSFAIWWALQMQNLTQNFFSESLTITATDEALSNLLQGVIVDEDESERIYRLAAFQEIVELPQESRDFLLARMIERLGMLSFRCFPSYRPMIDEYAKIIRQLETGNTDTVGERLAAIEEERVLLRQASTRTRDYLDWYRISTATDVTGDFRSYQELKRKLATQPTLNPGPIDRYLDGIQRLYDQ